MASSISQETGEQRKQTPAVCSRRHQPTQRSRHSFGARLRSPHRTDLSEREVHADRQHGLWWIPVWLWCGQEVFGQAFAFARQQIGQERSGGGVAHGPQSIAAQRAVDVRS